jgi:hypothetical protein
VAGERCGALLHQFARLARAAREDPAQSAAWPDPDDRLPDPGDRSPDAGNDLPGPHMNTLHGRRRPLRRPAAPGRVTMSISGCAAGSLPICPAAVSCAVSAGIPLRGKAPAASS